MIPVFSAEMNRKWQKGVQEYGKECRIDPYDEAMNEAIDLANYSMEIYFRLKRLKEKTKGLNK